MLSSIRAQGNGGQNVNKVSSAIHLRFDFRSSSLPQRIKEGLEQMRDSRITADGVIVIKAQQFRTREKNKHDALRRLNALLQQANKRQKARRATSPTRGSQLRRMDSKSKRGLTKRLRSKVTL